MLRRVKNLIIYFWVPITLINPLILYATNNVEKFKFYHLGTKDGLSQSRVSKIYEDKQGYMWFGTQSGLNRWDGYTFKNYFSEPGDSSSLSHNQITDIYQGIHDNFWVGTSEGLNLFLINKEAFIRVSLSGNIRNEQVFNITEDQTGNLWIASNHGILKK
jgi:ligand-binding sensor domain-containing protein